jgi:hypothetical protein
MFRARELKHLLNCKNRRVQEFLEFKDILRLKILDPTRLKLTLILVRMMTWIYLKTLMKKKFVHSAWISWIKTKILRNFLQSKVKQYKNLLLKSKFKTSDLEELGQKLGVEIQ